MADNLNQITVELLSKNQDKFLTAREIAEWIFENKKGYCQDKMNRTIANTKEKLLLQIVAEIGSHHKSLEKLNILRTSDRPHKYFYSDNNSPCQDTTCGKPKNNQPEHALYPKLAKFCNSIGIQTLRIDEKTSKKEGGKNHNIWLHADFVGFKDLTQNFNNNVKECLIQYSSERSYLYSFEVKDGIIKSCNLRENFFQTVSNSSWANYSYLVAEGIEEKAKEELQLLCASFKIGFIQLDKETPEDSDIVIQAPKKELDWNMINRIAVENPDFQQYLKNISLSYRKHTDSDIKSPKWDIDKIK